MIPTDPSSALDRLADRSTSSLADLAEERDRIARDLHDHVVQRLFIVGLKLAGATQQCDLSGPLEEALAEIDSAIAEIRSVIYSLQRPRAVAIGGDGVVRAMIEHVIGDLVPVLGHQPVVNFDGPLDEVHDEVISEAAVVVRELLVNALKHADCHQTWVTATALGNWLSIEVADDGDGVRSLHPAQGGTGLRSLAQRARRNGGSFEVRPRDPSGTVVRWTVPVA